jgi:CHAD domain-containing protein
MAAPTPARLDTQRFATEEVQKRLGRLALQIGRTIRMCDPDAVHDLRVATRRFAQALIALKPCLRAKEVKRVRRSLKNLMMVAGEVRNCDIAVKLLARPAEPASALLDEFGARRKEAQRALVTFLKRLVWQRTSARWRADLEIIGGTAESVEEMAESSLARLGKRFLRRGQAAAKTSASAEELHQLRIAAKKLRYTLELFAPIETDTLLEKVVQVQTRLGAINDCQTVRAMLHGMPGSEKHEARLKRRQHRKTEEFRREWPCLFGEEWTVRRKPMTHSLTATQPTEDRTAEA